MLFDFLHRLSLNHLVISVLVTVLAAVTGIVALLLANLHAYSGEELNIIGTIQKNGTGSWGVESSAAPVQKIIITNLPTALQKTGTKVQCDVTVQKSGSADWSTTAAAQNCKVNP